jgi:hypothetical protein
MSPIPLAENWFGSPLTVRATLSKTIDVFMRAPHIRNRQLHAQPVSQTIVQIQCGLLRNGTGLFMVIQNHLSTGLVDGRNYAGGPPQESHRRVVVNTVDREQTRLRHLLLRPDNDKTIYRSARG